MMSNSAWGFIFLIIGLMALYYAFKVKKKEIKESKSALISFCQTLGIGIGALVGGVLLFVI